MHITEVRANDGTATQDRLGLTGQRVLVAGAGGIGSACAEACVDVGARAAGDVPAPSTTT